MATIEEIEFEAQAIQREIHDAIEETLKKDPRYRNIPLPSQTLTNIMLMRKLAELSLEVKQIKGFLVL